MRWMATLGLCAIVGSGCLTISSETNHRESGYDATWATGAGGGRKIGVVALVPEKGIARNQWFRRKVTTMVEALVFGLIPWPWDLRLVYSPSAVTLWDSFPAAAVSPELGVRIAEALKAKGFVAEGVDTAAATDASGNVTVQGLVDDAGKKGCQLLYLVACNEFVELRFKDDEDQSGEVIFHDISTLKGSTLIPSTAVFEVGGKRLLARARQFERFFYTPMLTWGWQSPYSDQKGYADQMAWLEKLAAKDLEAAREKLATYVVERDFGPAPLKPGEPAAPSAPAAAPAPEPPKTAALPAEPAAPAKG